MLRRTARSNSSDLLAQEKYVQLADGSGLKCSSQGASVITTAAECLQALQEFFGVCLTAGPPTSSNNNCATLMGFRNDRPSGCYTDRFSDGGHFNYRDEDVGVDCPFCNSNHGQLCIRRGQASTTVRLSYFVCSFYIQAI